MAISLGGYVDKRSFFFFSDDFSHGKALGMFRRTFIMLIALASFTCGVSHAQQWEATSLHPWWQFIWSRGKGIGPGEFGGVEQVGYTADSIVDHAAMWSETANSWVDLNPLPESSSHAYGVYAGQQVGDAWLPNANEDYRQHACLWYGTAASYVDLHPTSDTSTSCANATDGVHQVGWKIEAWDPNTGESFRYASIWSGTAASLLIVHPSSAKQSVLNGVFGVRQAGYTVHGPLNVSHAGLWRGSANSWLDLHPSSESQSEVMDIQRGQQVGYTIASQLDFAKAAIWRNTAASYKSLNPSGASASIANAVFDGYQVGFADFGYGYQAIIWYSSSTKYDILPAPVGEWYDLVAEGVWADSENVYVVGHGLNVEEGFWQAILWVGPRELACLGDFNGDGFVNGSDYDDFVDAFDNGDASADFNGDGFVNGNDYDEFVDAWLLGC